VALLIDCEHPCLVNLQGSTSVPRILVVDDQPDIRLMCRVNLQLEGYEVIEAADGEAGLETVKNERPDLVLLDVMMPGLDGWQFMEAIKADEKTAKIPIVLLTARVQREDEIRGWLSGAADYLPKPFNPSTLTEVVRRTLLGNGGEDRRRRALDKLSII
jgi:DNA-binding response OmpR family regulator